MKARNRNKARKAERQIEAEHRQAIYDAKTLDEKLNAIRSRRGNSLGETYGLIGSFIIAK